MHGGLSPRFFISRYMGTLLEDTVTVGNALSGLSLSQAV